MKCALVIPSWKPEDIFPARTAASQVNYWQPLGVLYVGSSLQQENHEVELFNGAFLGHGELVKKVRDNRPEFIGVYSTAFGWPQALRTIEDMRKELPEAFIAVGGPYPIAVQEECLAATGALDAVVTGEGEFTVAEITERVAGGRDLDGVEGVIFRKDGRIQKNPPRPLAGDLDRIPFPARSLLGEREKYLPPPATYRRTPVATMITSRGCSRRCIFCFQIDRERTHGIRYRSVGNVLTEIELCCRQGYREIKFLDDTLAADYGRAMELCRGIRERDFDVTWFASACVNQVDEPLLREFRRSGCWAVLLGAESGVQKNLNALRKGITLEQTRRAVRAAKRAGLTVHTPFIIGLPGETVEEARRTIDFACELSPDIASFHALTPFPGTDLYDEAARYGTVSANLADYTYQGAAFVPHTMTAKEIAMLRQEAYRRFYSRPRYLARRLSRVRTARDISAASRGLRSLWGLWVRRGIFDLRSPASCAEGK